MPNPPTHFAELPTLADSISSLATPTDIHERSQRREQSLEVHFRLLQGRNFASSLDLFTFLSEAVRGETAAIEWVRKWQEDT